MSENEEKTDEQKRIEELETENTKLREAADAAEPEGDTRSAMQKMSDAYGEKGGE